jgi:peptidoglycan hydrolase CwlO-like protein
MHSFDHGHRVPTPHRAAALTAAVLATAAALAGLPGSSRGDLQSRYQSHKQAANQLQSKIHAETSKIRAYEGTISSLESRLRVVERSVAYQERLLSEVQTQLTTARTRLATLRRQYVHGQAVLAAQLRRNYESPAPNLVNVIVDSGGFNDLLNKLNNMRAIERRNAQTVQQVITQRKLVSEQAKRFATVLAQRRRAAAAVLAERDQIARLRLSIVDRELRVQHARVADSKRLKGLQSTLAHEAKVLDARAAAAGSLSSGGVAPPPGGCVNTAFVAHGGEWGFFQAAGTDYSVNQEPIIAARLDALGKALHLHLEGISGYRTPQHSVEVGGFADDPNTHGLASDTPGVEGVPEATLLEFCLTRPFPGPAEADHIQES